MSQDILETLNKINPNILAEVARRSLNLPSFELRDWTVSPLTHEKVIETTGACLPFAGMGRMETKKRPGQ